MRLLTNKVEKQDFGEFSQKSCFLFTGTSVDDIVVLGILAKGCEYMKTATQRVQNMFITDQEHRGNIDASILQKELIKGMQSVKKGEVYTLEEAWKEIDMIHV